MNQEANYLEKWFLERPRWLQIAASRLFEKTKLSEDDFVELTLLCKQEACGELPKLINLFQISAFQKRKQIPFVYVQLVGLKE